MNPAEFIAVSVLGAAGCKDDHFRSVMLDLFIGDKPKAAFTSPTNVDNVCVCVGGLEKGHTYL